MFLGFWVSSTATPFTSLSLSPTMLPPGRGSVLGSSQKLVEVICLDEDDEDCVVVERTVHTRVEKTVEVIQRGDGKVRYDTVVERRVEEVVTERGGEDATAAPSVGDVPTGGIVESLEEKLLDDLQDTPVAKEEGDASKAEDESEEEKTLEEKLCLLESSVGHRGEADADTEAKEVGDASKAEDESEEEKRLEEKLCLLESSVGHRGEADADTEAKEVGDASKAEDESEEEKRLEEKLCLLESSVGHRGEADADTEAKEVGDASKAEDESEEEKRLEEKLCLLESSVGHRGEADADTEAKEVGDASKAEDESEEEKRLEEKLCLLESSVGHRGEADADGSDEDEESNLITEKLEQGEDGEGVSDYDSEGDDEEMAALLAQSLRKFLTERSPSRKETITPESSSRSGDQDDGMMYIDDTRKRRADETAAMALQTVWIPAETGLPKIDSKMPSAPSKTIPQRMEESLADGLLVPSMDAKKQRKLAKKSLKETSGAKWFDMAAPTVTPQIRKEFQLLKLRNVIDPKRHYKPNDTKGIPKYFQFGTVVEGHADFYSGRLTKKECKQSFADELLGNTDLKNYRKRKYTEIQEQKSAGGKNFYKQKKNARRSSWART